MTQVRHAAAHKRCKPLESRFEDLLAGQAQAYFFLLLVVLILYANTCLTTIATLSKLMCSGSRWKEGVARKIQNMREGQECQEENCQSYARCQCLDFSWYYQS